MLLLSYNGVEFLLSVIQKSLLSSRSKERLPNGHPIGSVPSSQPTHIDIVRLSCTALLHLSAEDGT